MAIIEPGLPARKLLGDPVRLRQIAPTWSAMRLLTSEGRVVLRVSSRRQSRLAAVHFSVRDTGIGMNAAAVATLFTVHPGRWPTTGVLVAPGGRSICEGLVEAMGGQIGVSSESARAPPSAFPAAADCCCSRTRPVATESLAAMPGCW